MDLFEFEGKQLLGQAGVAVPASRLILSEREEAGMPYPFVLKAQTMTGGRGKAGGIQVCSDQAEYQTHAQRILHMTIKGHPVYALLAEEMVHAERELYLSITLQGVAAPTLIASAAGGMEIEQVAAQHPEQVVRMQLDPLLGVQPHQIGYLQSVLGVPDREDLGRLVEQLWTVFCQNSALLVEINPLGLVDNKLVAMDAKVVLDDHAQFRMGQVFQSLCDRREQMGYQQAKGDGTTITFVPLEGDVGLISDGAGTGMLSLDLIYRMGGTVASFCELGGTTPASTMYKAMEYTLGTGRTPKSLLVVLIGGFNRMDDMANGITGYIRDHGLDIPIFTRMCGTMEEAGYEIMAQAGLQAGKDLMQTVRQAVDASREGSQWPS